MAHDSLAQAPIYQTCFRKQSQASLPSLISRTDIAFDAVPVDAVATSQARLNIIQGAAFRSKTTASTVPTTMPSKMCKTGSGEGIKNYNYFAQDGDGAEIAQQLARGGPICNRVVFRPRPSFPTNLPRLVNLHD